MNAVIILPWMLYYKYFMLLNFKSKNIAINLAIDIEAEKYVAIMTA